MARLAILIPLLALALTMTSLGAAAAQPGVSVQAPFTSVNVGGGGGDSSSKHENMMMSGWHSGGGACKSHHAWLMGHVTAVCFHAELSGKKMIAPNSTTPAPIDTPATGHAFVCVVEEDGETKLITRLTLCSIVGYVAAHHHYGGPDRDFPPPVLAIEPPIKPADPLAPPEALPMLMPPVDVPSAGGLHHKMGGCRNVEVTLSASDLIVVPGGPASWDELLTAAVAGDVYLSAHTIAHPAGEIRGNLEPCDV